MSKIYVQTTITRYVPTEDGDRDVISAFAEEYETHPDDGDAISSVLTLLEKQGVSFKSWGDPVHVQRITGNINVIRAISVDTYVHPGEGWHEETFSVVHAHRNTIRAMLARDAYATK